MPKPDHTKGPLARLHHHVSKGEPIVEIPATTKAPTLFETIADGLDASTDGRGWDAQHQAAMILANAAPAMRDALQTCLAELESELENDPDASLIEAAIKEAKAALALLEG